MQPGGFGFGTATQAKPAAAGGAGFSFGAAAQPQTPQTGATSGFSFGATAQQPATGGFAAAASGSSGFSFGAAAQKPAGQTGFASPGVTMAAGPAGTFGVTKPASGFSFGAAGAAAAGSPAKPAGSAFSFGAAPAGTQSFGSAAKPAGTSNFSFGGSTAPSYNFGGFGAMAAGTAAPKFGGFGSFSSSGQTNSGMSGLGGSFSSQRDTPGNVANVYDLKYGELEANKMPSTKALLDQISILKQQHEIHKKTLEMNLAKGNSDSVHGPKKLNHMIDQLRRSVDAARNHFDLVRSEQKDLLEQVRDGLKDAEEANREVQKFSEWQRTSAPSYRPPLPSPFLKKLLGRLQGRYSAYEKQIDRIQQLQTERLRQDSSSTTTHEYGLQKPITAMEVGELVQAQQTAFLSLADSVAQLHQRVEALRSWHSEQARLRGEPDPFTSEVNRREHYMKEKKRHLLQQEEQAKAGGFALGQQPGGPQSATTAPEQTSGFFMGNASTGVAGSTAASSPGGFSFGMGAKPVGAAVSAAGAPPLPPTLTSAPTLPATGGFNMSAAATSKRSMVRRKKK